MARVLIVNDSRFESMILKDTLSQLGYNVSITDEYSAVKQVQAFTPDVVLANYVMKDTFGDQLIERIKVRYPQIKCILTSNSELSRDDLKSGKVDAILKTPADKEALEDMLHDVFDAGNPSTGGGLEIKEIRATMRKWKSKLAEEKQFTM